jgi:hypothetical protein
MKEDSSMFPRLITLAAIVLVLSGSAAVYAGHHVYVPVVPVAPYVAYAPPVAYYAPAPYVAYYPPAAVYPPVAAYPPPYATYAPVVVPPAPVQYVVPGRNIYGGPRLYVPGEPVRNAVRAVTP